MTGRIDRLSTKSTRMKEKSSSRVRYLSSISVKFYLLHAYANHRYLTGNVALGQCEDVRMNSLMLSIGQEFKGKTKRKKKHV